MYVSPAGSDCYTTLLYFSLPFLCDAAPPASAHTSFLLVSKYAELAGLHAASPADPLLPPQLLQTALDSLPQPDLEPVLGTDAVLFSLSHSLHSLLLSCRATLHSGTIKYSTFQPAITFPLSRYAHPLSSPERPIYSPHTSSNKVSFPLSLECMFVTCAGLYWI